MEATQTTTTTAPTTPDVQPVPSPTTDSDPWIADLKQSSEVECQSTTDFEDPPCAEVANWYVQLEITGYPTANPRWEGKLCEPCLTGWQEWARDQPDAVRVVAVHPLVSG